MSAIVRHLHAAAREVNLTPDEWIAGIGFLTATGHACNEYRQPDDEGFYDLQKQDPSQMELRGRFLTDEEGRYRAIRPVGYKIPMDGPVGDMVRAQGRHGWRPPHNHRKTEA